MKQLSIASFGKAVAQAAKEAHAKYSPETAEMTRSCARDLTDRIKAAAADLADLLWRAHQGKAWTALGYESWKAYCAAEFQFSKQRSYQLLDFVEIRQSLSETSPPGLTPANEKQTRELVKLAPVQREPAWNRAVEIAEGNQPKASQVKQAVEELETEEEDNELEPPAGVSDALSSPESRTPRFTVVDPDITPELDEIAKVKPSRMTDEQKLELRKAGFTFYKPEGTRSVVLLPPNVSKLEYCALTHEDQEQQRERWDSYHNNRVREKLIELLELIEPPFNFPADLYKATSMLCEDLERVRETIDEMKAAADE